MLIDVHLMYICRHTLLINFYQFPSYSESCRFSFRSVDIFINAKIFKFFSLAYLNAITNKSVIAVQIRLSFRFVFGKDTREICKIMVKSHEASDGGTRARNERGKGGGGRARAKNRRGESGKPNNRPAPTSVSVRSSGEKEEMKWTVRLTGIYILSCAICVSELCRVTVRRIRSGKSVIITRARGARRSILFPPTFARSLAPFFPHPFRTVAPSFVSLTAT